MSEILMLILGIGIGKILIPEGTSSMAMTSVAMLIALIFLAVAWLARTLFGTLFAIREGSDDDHE